jgi:hypothetical protein
LRTKSQPRKTGISLDDIEPFIRAVKGVKKFGYDLKRLATLMSNFQDSSKMLEGSVKSQMSKIKDLTDDCDRLETLVLNTENLMIWVLGFRN